MGHAALVGVGVSRATLVAALIAGWPGMAAAQPAPHHVLIITGLSGEPAFARAFEEAGGGIRDAARRWGVADSNLTWLAEDPARDRNRIRGRAVRAEVEAAFGRLARQVRPGEVVLVVLIGHGSGEGRASKVNLIGPDPEAWEYAAWLGPLQRATVVFVNAASASGDFVAELSAPNRIVVTSTRGATERNESIFATHFAHGLSSGEADADKDGRISVLEAYDYARQSVRRAYEADNKLLTEHAQLDDNGDRRGSAEPDATAAGDGLLARQVAFGGPPASGDPRIVALLAERRALEAEVTALRTRRAMTDSTAYQRELERLLLLIAEKTAAIRALERGGRP